MANSAAAKSGVAKKKPKAPKEVRGYSGYLHKIMKKSCESSEGNITISGTAMAIVNDLIFDLEERVTDKSFVLAKLAKKATLAAPHVQTAAKLVFPQDMGGMAVSEASKALTKYTSA